MSRTWVITIAIVVLIGSIALAIWWTLPPPRMDGPQSMVDSAGFKDGIHLATGLKQGEGLELVIGNCTNCHSAKLITQNRASREGWKSMIVWMQETQKLWDLGDNEDKILDYLETNYAPEYRGRRPPLEQVEWYIMDEEN